MKLILSKGLALMAAALFVSGCSVLGIGESAGYAPSSTSYASILSPEIAEYADSTEDILFFTAQGAGIAPKNTVSPAHAMLLAKKAAMIDAYAQLAGKINGVKINSRETVKDAMLKSSTASSYISGLVKNANVVDEGFVDGMYQVQLEAKIDRATWDRLFYY